MRTEEAIKTFRKNFESLSMHRSYSETFNDFLDFALYMLNPFKDEGAYKEVEHVDKKYKNEEAKYMAGMFEAWTHASDNDGAGFYDALGDIFMELLSYGKNGQFFTPQPICDMMAQLTYGEDLEEGKSVNDPACGSGRTLLAIAKLQRRLKFYGADVDLTCCKMTVLNMLVNSMPGEVAWMNTLTMEHYRSWHIRLIRNEDNFYIPYYYCTGSGETNFIQRLENTIQEQPQEQPPSEIILNPQQMKRRTMNQLNLF